MARFRRKSCLPLAVVVLLVLIVTVVLKALAPEDAPLVSPVGGERSPGRESHEVQKDNTDKPDRSEMSDSARSDKLEAALRKFPPPNYYLHAFYYPWYGNPKFDGQYIHWDHPQLPHWDSKVAQGYPQGRHVPPDDIGANFYPSLGAYSSRDPSIIEYGEHPAFFKYRTNTGKLLPLFYVYDSYLMNSEQWAKLLKHTASDSLRDTPYDAVFIALLVEEKHKRDILTAGFDGFYTYFATNGFSYGSTQRNWDSLKAFCEDNDLIFIASVGPGYIDTSIRPWNFQNTRNRINGKYYETSLSAALKARPDFISITSFNEWHEGSQIEMAVPKTGHTAYLDYLPNKPAIYLEITRKWAAIFGGERRKWRD
ncbi:Glycoprotein endo-alpha-1,2-mannosidase [Liparis tanakae]|uniref:Glycoprotein endo-alpha-1,2-mannosidase n=1 Tax=Liparis tanakae TaxID=230148 RepID=A0A4Z2F9V2_9TELE|nr:Glycoprotein endo-alpha-1,2-mannosidase [Liparis tanakae]